GRVVRPGVEPGHPAHEVEERLVREVAPRAGQPRREPGGAREPEEVVLREVEGERAMEDQPGGGRGGERRDPGPGRREFGRGGSGRSGCACGRSHAADSSPSCRACRGTQVRPTRVVTHAPHARWTGRTAHGGPRNSSRPAERGWATLASEASPTKAFAAPPARPPTRPARMLLRTRRAARQVESCGWEEGSRVRLLAQIMLLPVAVVLAMAVAPSRVSATTCVSGQT